MEKVASDQQPNSSLEPTEEVDLFKEKSRIARLSRIRQIVFGSLDGLLVPLGVISGVAGGTGNSRAVIIAGLSEAFAGALSMGVGEFIAGQSEAQVQQAEVKKELEEMKEFPEYELNEMVQLLQAEGVTNQDAPIIAGYLQKNPRFYAKTMVATELGLDIDTNPVKISEGVTMGLSYIIASIVPLIAYFFLSVDVAFYVSLGLSFLFLVGIGILRGVLAKTDLFKSALTIVVVGSISGLGGYLLGTWLPKLFGL